ncbi:hypothetical protein C3L33_17290, partial [Rhododendron williamsianum]
MRFSIFAAGTGSKAERMASVLEEGPYSVKVLAEESSSSSSSNPTNAVIFVGISLVLGIASRHLLGAPESLTPSLSSSSSMEQVMDWERLAMAFVFVRANIDPNLLLAVFLPALLFESSFSMEVHQIKKCMAQMIILAGPGVLISTFCLGSALKLTFPYDWSWKTSLLLGGLLSATDPVAVVALLKELGASKKLSTIIEGESLMNDGTAIVVYQLFYRIVFGESFSFGAIVEFLMKVSLGAVGIGLAFGIASVLWLGFIFNDTVIEIALTLTVSYIAFFTFRSVHVLSSEARSVSLVFSFIRGLIVLRCVLWGYSGFASHLGVWWQTEDFRVADANFDGAISGDAWFFAAVGRTAFKGDGQQSLHHFWLSCLGMCLNSALEEVVHVIVFHTTVLELVFR